MSYSIYLRMDTGADPLINPPAYDLNRFQRLFKEFGHGTASSPQSEPNHTR